MVQSPLIEEVINYPIAGKEQFFSHELNNQFKLYKSKKRFLYVYANLVDYNVYVSSSDGALDTVEVEFIKTKYSKMDFILTDAKTDQSKEIPKPIEITIGNENIIYSKVLT